MEVEMARFDLTDFEWSVIAPLLPNPDWRSALPKRPNGANLTDQSPIIWRMPVNWRMVIVTILFCCNPPFLVRMAPP
jgi:transposase